MFSTDDTIVAVATPPGRGGIGVVRISGAASREIARRLLDRPAPLEPRRATYARVPGVDDVVATLFVGPRSYTGEDVVEVSAHGNPVVLQAIVQRAIDAGARLAEPGEFTLRAFLAGKIDLVQSEAVADLIDAATPMQARTAFDQLQGSLTRRIAAIDASLFDVIARLEASLDFPDEGFHFIEPSEIGRSLNTVVAEIDLLLREARRGRTIREGAQVAIIGRTNSGKSSLFNALAGHDRAIVTATPGTTRDLLTERIDVAGIPVTLVDTAGMRDSDDDVEREGIDRARRAAETATLLLLVLDGSAPLTDDDCNLVESTSSRERIVIRNKADLPFSWTNHSIDVADVEVSALKGRGIEVLRSQIAARLMAREELRDAPAISNARHIALLDRARDHLLAALAANSTASPVPEEFLLTDLQQARMMLEEVSGRRTPEAVLQHIFERFCVGK